ncbi:MAG TPA: MarR family transcriptional regulator [Azospirillaceae bacterium]|nr:MarR family transcriptional regulator [Azospirillaceae bacterium]
MTAETPQPRRGQRSLPLDLMEELRRLDEDMSLKEAAALLYVAENEGLSLSELRWVMRVTPSTVSRVVARLSDGLNGRPGLGLLEVGPWPSDARVRCVRLSAEARQLLGRVWRRARAADAAEGDGVQGAPRAGGGAALPLQE